MFGIGIVIGMFMMVVESCRMVNNYRVCEIPQDIPAAPFEEGYPHDVQRTNAPNPTIIARSSTFSATLVGSFEDNHRDAVQHCMNIAAGFWPSDVSVKVNFSRLQHALILGSASPSRNWIVNGYICPVALAEAIVGEDLNGDFGGDSKYDILMTLNTETNWYLGKDGRPVSRQYDLVTVCLHEVFHGLFMSGGNIGISVGEDLNYNAIFLRENSMGRFDSFMANQDSCSIKAYQNNTAYLGQVLTGNNLWFVSDRHRIARLHAPTPYTPGSSLYHLSETEYAADQDDLMTPAIGSNYAQHQPGGILLSILQLVLDVEANQGANQCDFINPPQRDDTPVEQDTGNGQDRSNTEEGGFRIRFGNTWISGWAIVGAAIGGVTGLVVVCVVLKCVFRGTKEEEPKRRVHRTDLRDGNAGGLV